MPNSLPSNGLNCITAVFLRERLWHWIIHEGWYAIKQRNQIKPNQTFCDNLLNTVFFHVQPTCDHSNSQPTIATNDLPYLLDIELSPAGWKPPTSEVIFHHLAPLFKPIVPLKTTCITWYYLHTRAEAYQTRPKISGLFICKCSSFIFSAHSTNYMVSLSTWKEV